MVIHSITILDHKNNTHTYEVDGLAPGGFRIKKIDIVGFCRDLITDSVIHIAASSATAVALVGPFESTAFINPTIVSITYS